MQVDRAAKAIARADANVDLRTPDGAERVRSSSNRASSTDVAPRANAKTDATDTSSSGADVGARRGTVGGAKRKSGGGGSAVQSTAAASGPRVKMARVGKQATVQDRHVHRAKRKAADAAGAERKKGKATDAGGASSRAGDADGAQSRGALNGAQARGARSANVGGRSAAQQANADSGLRAGADDGRSRGAKRKQQRRRASSERRRASAAGGGIAGSNDNAVPKSSEKARSGAAPSRGHMSTPATSAQPSAGDGVGGPSADADDGRARGAKAKRDKRPRMRKPLPLSRRVIAQSIGINPAMTRLLRKRPRWAHYRFRKVFAAAVNSSLLSSHESVLQIMAYLLLCPFYIERMRLFLAQFGARRLFGHCQVLFVCARLGRRVRASRGLLHWMERWSWSVLVGLFCKLILILLFCVFTVQRYTSGVADWQLQDCSSSSSTFPRKPQCRLSINWSVLNEPFCFI